jgi:hypothetical protein
LIAAARFLFSDHLEIWTAKRQFLASTKWPSFARGLRSRANERQAVAPALPVAKYFAQPRCLREITKDGVKAPLLSLFARFFEGVTATSTCARYGRCGGDPAVSTLERVGGLSRTGVRGCLSLQGNVF